MSDSDKDELEEIREKKKQELMERQESGGTTGESTPDEPIHVTGPDHFESIISDHEVVLVDCHADWCGPCKMIEPIVEDLAATTEAAIAKIDVDANQALAGQLGAQSIPTLILYVDGEPAERMVGAQDEATLRGLVTQHTGE